MPITEVKVSQNTFEEIANGLEALGVKINKEASITITKDISIKGPINYRQTAIRKDVLIEVVKVYKAPVNENEIEINDVAEFINFLDAVYLYILKGDKPTDTTQKIDTTVKIDAKTKPKAGGW